MSAQLLAAQTAPAANRFTKLDASGNALPPDATDHAMVHDTATGLTWLVAYASPKELTHAAAEKAAAKVKAGGHEDWRLPTRFELESILDITRRNPPIDTDTFPGTHSDWHWTASPVASYPDCAWMVSFRDGYVDDSFRGNYAWVRAVRGPRGIADGYHDALKIWRQRAEQAEARLAALAELERAAAEPVAWMWNDMLGISHTYVSSKRPTWPDAGAISEMAAAINVRPLYAAPVAEIREVVVTDEMCGRVFAAACGTEVSDGAFRVTRKLLAAWRAELGPALGLVELKEPTPEECELICTEYERLLMREGTCGGRDAFDAVRAVMWPKEGL